MSTLYANGCSFTAGEADQSIKKTNKSWCNHLGFTTVINDAWPGNSNTSIIRRTLEYISAGNCPDLVVIQLSGHKRHEILMPKEARKDRCDPFQPQDQTTSINYWSATRRFPEVSDFFITHMAGIGGYSLKYHNQRTLTGIMTLEHVCKNRNISCVVFNGLEPLDVSSNFTQFVDLEKIYLPEWSMKQEYQLGDQHPSEEQHQDWGERLAEYFQLA